MNLTLSSDNKTASFTAPEVKQNTPLIFKLTATDEENQTATKDVTVNVMAPPPNQPPEVTITANASDSKPGQGIEMKLQYKMNSHFLSSILAADLRDSHREPYSFV